MDGLLVEYNIEEIIAGTPCKITENFYLGLGPINSRSANNFYPASAGQTREESSVRFKHNQTEGVGRFTAEDMPQPAQLGAQNLNTKAGGFASAAGGGI